MKTPVQGMSAGRRVRLIRYAGMSRTVIVTDYEQKLRGGPHRARLDVWRKPPDC